MTISESSRCRVDASTTLLIDLLLLFLFAGVFLTACGQSSVTRPSPSSESISQEKDLEGILYRPFSCASWQVDVRIKYDRPELARYCLTIVDAERQMLEWAKKRQGFSVEELLSHELTYDGEEGQKLRVRVSDVADIRLVFHVSEKTPEILDHN